MPGTFVVQAGQLGSQTSLFIRGGDSDDNKVLLDGVDAGDLGNQFDFGSLSTTAIESAEVYRGPDSNLFGAGAEAGVVSSDHAARHHQLSFPALSGRCRQSRHIARTTELAGAHKKLDYLGAFSWLQTANDLPNDEFHVATSAANLGWALNGTTQIRATAALWRLCNRRSQRLGLLSRRRQRHRKGSGHLRQREPSTTRPLRAFTTAFVTASRASESRNNLWQMSGIPVPPADYFTDYCFGPGTLGATCHHHRRQRLLRHRPGSARLRRTVIHSQIVSNRDQLVYRGDITITPHLMGLIGFQYEDERGAEPGSSFYPPVERIEL